MPEINRPLSPHLGIYKWSVTMALSVLHRMTGVALSLCALALVTWIVAAASGGAFYTAVTDVLTGWFGILLLVGFSASFFIHLGNGIRHLFWDAGYGFGQETAHKTGVLTLVVAAVLTVLFLLRVWA
ncbi:MAG: succinate dehydrogenase, cytochrome b556 subunit [Gammaproteobacteria bacterium]|nr:succinate dehydrogenase, cytochrome b556 subunit [Gammaproteobacteria bacterium]